jgi:hypothetical protein
LWTSHGRFPPDESPDTIHILSRRLVRTPLSMLLTAVCMALISLGLMTTVHPAAIAGATLIAIEPAPEFHGVNMLYAADRWLY